MTNKGLRSKKEPVFGECIVHALGGGLVVESEAQRMVDGRRGKRKRRSWRRIAKCD